MNISKHSGAESCDVWLRFGQDRMVLEVRDTGNGFEPNEVKGSTGLGLESMRERLRSVAGKLRIDSAPNRGTRVYAEVPFKRTAEADLHVKDSLPNVPAA
jgi:signal transduction histidine kinase